MTFYVLLTILIQRGEPRESRPTQQKEESRTSEITTRSKRKHETVTPNYSPAYWWKKGIKKEIYPLKEIWLMSENLECNRTKLYAYTITHTTISAKIIAKKKAHLYILEVKDRPGT